MQLSKLEVKGFKSFADKVIIHFDEGVTGIVGPNGCGKSNVVDAIRWALGEQKTSVLRSEKMENIIFNGASNRSTQQMAEVSLTINNTKNILPTEYAQVTITRRLYRSGESEYLLNGVNCRLKDISNLFMDTGIASNSYAIIELGMVDDLLNDRDSSRRALFEEAAGISKFKKRKRETFKKLEDTDADLERLSDVLFELERNMKALEKQAKQTELFFKIKEEYKQKSVEFAQILGHRQREEFSRLQSDIDNENAQKAQIIAQLAEKDALVENVKNDRLTKERTLASRQKNINEFAASIQQAENDKKIKSERLRYLSDRIKELEQQIGIDNESHAQTAQQLEQLMRDKAQAESGFEQIAQALAELKQAYEQQKGIVGEEQQALEKVRQDFRAQQEVVINLDKEINIREVKVSSVQQESDRAYAEAKQQSATLAACEQRLTALREAIEAKQQSLDNLNKEEEENLQSISSAEKEIEALRETMTQKSRRLDARQNEYQLTKSLVENLEGFPEAIKFLNKNVSWAKNAPLLSDVIATTEEYRVTIENYLEPYLNYYLVEHEAEAYRAINILSDASKGKANFFILQAFGNEEPAQPAPIANAVPALSIVEFDARYAPLMNHLLRNAYVFDGDYAAMPSEDDCVFLAKNGKVTKRKFSLSGGSVGLFEGKKIGRAKNLEKLEKEIQALSKEAEDTRQALLDKQRALEQLRHHSLRQRIGEARNQFKLVNDECISVQTKRDQIAALLGNADERNENFRAQIQTLTEELQRLKPQAEERKNALKATEEKIAALQAHNAEQSIVLNAKSTAYNEKNIVFHREENKIKSFEQEIAFKRQVSEQSAERIGRNQQETETHRAEIHSLAYANEQSDSSLSAMYAEKEDMAKGVNEAEQSYYAARGAADEIDKEIKALQHQREKSDERLLQLQQELSESKLQLNSIKERISVEFGANLDETPLAPEAQAELPDEDKLKQDIGKLKNKMDNMGSINPMAMESYQETKERNDFILAQKEDLVKAKESLLNTIHEIETAASETFMTAFESIKGHFISVFRALFNEGDACDIRLADPSRPLDSDIDIIAMPKGKRPLGINQLSGGEKTLTATALLFSMYLLKPAPFCIFDEVDAPLDDANIDKFNDIVRQFSKDSQFIIVTHNKRTMSTTDVIYGITMVEKGVSQVVPVDLRQLA